VDLHGFDHQHAPLSPAQALELLLRSLGIAPTGLPCGPDERARPLRSSLDGRRVLIVLDNAVSAQQVRPLLPAASGCCVVVTSRNRLSGLVAREGAHPMTLAPLDPAAGRELLATLIGPHRVVVEPDTVDRLARRCGYLPLALRVAAAQLVGEPGRRTDRLACEGGRLATLALDGDPVSDVGAAFALSYRALSPTAQRLFRLLGLMPRSAASSRAVACWVPRRGRRSISCGRCWTHTWSTHRRRATTSSPSCCMSTPPTVPSQRSRSPNAPLRWPGC
jgi:hypothetical protein